MCSRVVDDFPASFTGPVTKLYILKIHEIAVVQQSYLLKNLIADKNACKACPFRLTNGFLDREWNDKLA